MDHLDGKKYGTAKWFNEKSEESWIFRVEKEIHAKLAEKGKGVAYVVCINDFEDAICAKERTSLQSRIGVMNLGDKVHYCELSLKEFFAMSLEE